MRAKKALSMWLEIGQRRWSPRVFAHVMTLCSGWGSRFGAGDVGAIGPAEVLRIHLSRADGKRSAAALNQERMYLRQFFRFCREMGWVDGTPETVWKRQKEVIRKQYVVLTKVDEAKLLAEANDLHDYIMFSIGTGLRQGTIRSLTWEMYSQETGVLNIPASIMKAKCALALPLSTALQQLCLRRRYLGSQSGLLFPELSLSGRNIWREFKGAVRRAGINPKTSPHDMRRTWVARMFAAGADSMEIQRIGGWKSSAVLIKHYVGAPLPERARALMEKI